MLVKSDHLAPWRETVCPIDLHTDYFAHSCRLVQHPPVHALVLRRMHEDMDGGTQERHVPGVQDQDQVRAGACAANRT